MSAFLFACLALGLPPQDGITYSCRATPISKVFQELSQLSGKTIQAAPDTQPEVLFLSVKEISFDRLMTNIAHVTSGEWEVSGDTYTLKADLRLRRKQAQMEADARAKEISKGIQTQLKQMAQDHAKPVQPPQKSKTEDDDAVQTGISSDPGEELCLKLAASLDPNLLAAVVDSRRLVWASNNPTSVQGTLPEGSGQMVLDWISEHNKQFASESAAELPDSIPDFGDPNISAKIQEMIRRETAQNQPIKDPITKALFVVSRGPMAAITGGKGLTFELMAFNGKGEVVLTAQATAGIDMSLLTPEAPSTPTSSTSSKSPEFHFSEDSAQIMSLADSGPMGMFNMRKLPQPLFEKLSKLDQTEPLSLMPSDLFANFGSVKQEQIVADIPDEVFSQLFGMMPGSQVHLKTEEDALNSIVKNKDLVIEDEDGVATIMSSQPSESRLNRLSRKPFTQLISSVIGKGYLSLDDISSYALSNPRIESNPVAMTYALLFCPNFLQMSMMGQSSWYSYRFYGSLTPDQRVQLRSGGQESFITLSSDQLEILSEYLYSTEAHLGDALPTKVDESSPFGSFDLAGVMGGASTASEEATELLPDGVGKGFITQTATTESIIGFAPGSGMFSSLSVSASEYGMMKAVSGTAMGGVDFTLPSQGRIGQRQNIELLFHLGPKAGAHCRLQDIFFDKSAPFASLDTLPAEFTAKMDAAKAMMKKVTDQAAKAGNSKSASP